MKRLLLALLMCLGTVSTFGQTAGNATTGAPTFTNNCSSCHGASPASGKSNIQNSIVAQTTKNAIARNAGGMGFLSSTIKDQDLNDLAAYAASVLGGTPTFILPAVVNSVTLSVPSYSIGITQNVPLASTSVAGYTIVGDTFKSVAQTSGTFPTGMTLGNTVSTPTQGTLTLSGTADTVGVFSSVWTVTTTGGLTSTITLSINVSAPVTVGNPNVTVTSATIVVSTVANSFATVKVTNTSLLRSLVLNSFYIALDPAQPQSIANTSPDFFVSAGGTNCKVGASDALNTPGDTCDIVVQFKPAGAGTKSAFLVVNTNAPTPSIQALTGTGTVVTASVSTAPTKLTFASYTTPVTKDVLITNTDLVALADVSFLLSNPAFTQTNNCPTSLAVGASCTAKVTFTYQVLDQITSDVMQVLRTEGAAKVVVATVPLVGDSTRPSGSTGGTTNFGGTPVAGNPILRYTLISNGLADARVTGVNVTGLYTIQPSSTCPKTTPFTLKITTSCYFDLQFTGNATDSKLGNLTITLATPLANGSNIVSFPITKDSPQSATASVDNNTRAPSVTTNIGGGGCTIGAIDDPLDPLLIGMILTSAYALSRRRKK
jgi:cytochrome c553